MKKTIITLLLSLFVAPSVAFAQTTEPFPEITVPAIYTDQASYVAYYVAHYWDRYDFAAYDKKYAEETTGQAFANFAYLLQMQSGIGAATPEAQSAVKTMLTRAAVSEDAYWHFLDLCEHYFYEPNSPMRNDEFFIPAIAHALSTKSPLDEDSKSRYRTLKKTVERNRPGTVATDFVYTTAGGSQGRMSQIKSDILIIYFYNPGCADCRRVKDMLVESEAVGRLHKEGRLKVLAVYPDEDLTEWKKYLSENPKWWISSYDKGAVVQSKNLYDLKAIPTLYLLDKDKNVVLKDPTPENLIGLLEML
ncbi:MAG: DUF5106 domain-containing protein [Tidjanibacter sp.]|nr:DUF5106 domain-containing protein [Tidjanibacter sp.]